MKYLWKGSFVDKEDIHIDLHDRGYQFGDGIYEVTHVYNGVLFALDEHIDRLINSAAFIELNLRHLVFPEPEPPITTVNTFRKCFRIL